MGQNSFLDYTKNIELDFTFTPEGEISYNINSLEENMRASNLETNLNNLAHIERSKESDDYDFYIGKEVFARISQTDRNWQIINRLTSFETRLLAQGKTTNGVPFDRTQKPSFLPQTDLHTHFAGVLPAEKLFELGLKHNINYPVHLLLNSNIDINKFGKTENEEIPLAEIAKDEKTLEILREKLSISTCKQETFNKMEQVYTARGPFTKNKALFEDSLLEIAKAYSESGTKYVELSHSGIISDLDYLETIHKKMPEIEASTGVQLRFLAALWRHSDKEWNADEVDRIKAVAKSPYVVGCDFMGHETNPTESFADEITSLATWAMENDPSFVIRVHAGENPIFNDNVKTTLQTVKQAYEKMKKTNDSVVMPNIRIGHGLYGVDKETLSLAKETGAVIEFNMSSNLSLNNINNIQDVPIQKYMEAGVDVVLGTDGLGIYGTYGEVEALLASAAGVTNFEQISKKEEEIIRISNERFSAKEALLQGKQLREELVPTYTNGNPLYTQEVALKHEMEKRELPRYLASKIQHANAITEPHKIEEAIQDKLPILITGASRSSWPNISLEHQGKIKELMQVLVDATDPEKAYFVTGGTNHGVEKELHLAANNRNKASDNKLTVLGTLTLEAANDATNEVERDTITHAKILTIDGRIANTWYDLPDAVLSFIQEKNGEMIAIGGGGVVRDMIQRAHNMSEIGINLMNGPEGASTDKSKTLAGNGYSFKTVEELLVRLHEKHPQIFSEKFNIKDYVSQIENKTTIPDTNNYSTFLLDGSKGEYESIMSVVNAVKSSNENPNKTIFCFDETSYAIEEPHILKSIKQVGKMIEKNGGKAFSSMQEMNQYILDNPEPIQDVTNDKKQEHIQTEDRVFLGGTCNNDMWREEEFIPMLEKVEHKLGIKKDYFNPVVPEWTPECMAEEIRQREVCDKVLYTLTEKAKGYYSYAEVVDDACKRPDRTMYCYMEDRPLSEEQKLAYQEIGAIVEEKGGKAFSNLRDVASTLYIEKAKNENNKNGHGKNSIREIVLNNGKDSGNIIK